jgi:hypothetical protein
MVDRTGAAFVVLGRDTAQADDFPMVFPLRTLLPPFGDGSAGFVARGIPEQWTGIAVGDAGDVNADGIDDVIIASKRDAYLIYGRDYSPAR